MATKSEKHTARVVLHLTPEMRRNLERVARAEKRSLAATCRVLLEEALGRYVALWQHERRGKAKRGE